MSEVFLFYFACMVFVLLGQIAAVGLAFVIGRKLRRSVFAWLFLAAYVIAAVRTIKSLTVYTDADLIYLMERYSSPYNLASAAAQPVAVWLIVAALFTLYWDMTGR